MSSCTRTTSNSMNVTCGIDQRVGRCAAGSWRRADEAPLALGYTFAGTSSWGSAPGWYELPPLASPGTFDDKCPNSSAGILPEE